MSSSLKSRRSLPILVAAVVAAAALAVAGCGGSSSGSATSGSGYGASANASKPSTGSANVRLSDTKLGKVLVDGSGRTLYLFEADKGEASTCNGACASAWPPVTTSANVVAGSGISPSMLGTTKRADGSTEVTYNGHPLYRYAGDSSAGQTNGEGIDDFGAEWYALSAAGSKVENES